MLDLKEKVSLLPTQPGCYLMKDKHEKIIYVGKAKNLRNRVRSYFVGQHEAKTEQLVSQICDFEYIVTTSEIEALILECNLIKKHRPRYNVMLKDDKSYPYIRLTNEEHPRLEVTRKHVNDGSQYFGPYPHAGAAQHTKKLLDRLYPLRKCRHLPKKACLYYHMGQCLAPCELPVSSEMEQEIAHQIVRFLKGETGEIKRKLKQEMEQAAEALEFEKAKELRDLIRDIEQTMERQNIVLKDQIDRDVFAYAYERGWMCVQVFFIRQGKWMERDVKLFPCYDEPQEAFLSYLAQFYQSHSLMPKEILLPMGVDDQLVSKLLPEVRVHIPKRGSKRKLVEATEQNALLALRERLQLLERDEEKTTLAIQELAEQLQIAVPNHIEAFDNSNLQGTHPVSAMVVFREGKPAKKEYRKYKIRSLQQADDVGMMKEVIRRRYTRLLREGAALPDLILVDGGKAQMRAASDVLENELGIYIPIGGMVKNEKHQTANLLWGEQGLPLNLPHDTQAFHLLQRIQNEVHRFAIAFHRQVRSRDIRASVLDAIPGVGAKRKQQLFRHFDSIAAMRQASIEEFRQAGIGEQLAKRIQAALQKKQKKN